jgi:hypothetical protein
VKPPEPLRGLPRRKACEHPRCGRHLHNDRNGPPPPSRAALEGAPRCLQALSTYSLITARATSITLDSFHTITAQGIPSKLPG